MAVIKAFRIVPAILLTIAALPFQYIVAHPGNVADDGAHYCRTNCASYGYDYGERICHFPSMGCESEGIRIDSYESSDETIPDPPEPEDPGDAVVDTSEITPPDTALSDSNNSSDHNDSWLGWVAGAGILGWIAYAIYDDNRK